MITMAIVMEDDDYYHEDDYGGYDHDACDGRDDDIGDDECVRALSHAEIAGSEFSRGVCCNDLVRLSMSSPPPHTLLSAPHAHTKGGCTPP